MSICLLQILSLFSLMRNKHIENARLLQPPSISTRLHTTCPAASLMQWPLLLEQTTWSEHKMPTDLKVLKGLCSEKSSISILNCNLQILQIVSLPLPLLLKLNRKIGKNFWKGNSRWPKKMKFNILQSLVFCVRVTFVCNTCPFFLKPENQDNFSSKSQSQRQRILLRQGVRAVSWKLTAILPEMYECVH